MLHYKFMLQILYYKYKVKIKKTYYLGAGAYTIKWYLEWLYLAILHYYIYHYDYLLKEKL